MEDGITITTKWLHTTSILYSQSVSEAVPQSVSEAVLHLYPCFGVLTVHLKLAFVGMEIVVASGEFDLVVKRIGSRETIEDAAVCYINVGKGGEFQRVAQQFFGEPCGGKSCIAVGRKSVKIARSVFVTVLNTYNPIAARIPIKSCKGVEGVALHGILSQAYTLRLAYIVGYFGTDNELTYGQ